MTFVLEFATYEVELDAEYVAQELFDFGGKMQTIIQRGMRTTPKTGRRYKRGRKTHIASSGGNYPAVDTGRLFGSISAETRRNELEIGVDAGSGVRYGKYVDETRPFLFKGLKDTLDANPNFLSDFLIVSGG